MAIQVVPVTMVSHTMLPAAWANFSEYLGKLGIVIPDRRDF